MQKDFDSWTKQKAKIHSSNRENHIYVKERDIWWCSIGLNIGDEEDGKNDSFERPVLVVKKFNRNIVLVVPLTTKIKDNKYYFIGVNSDTIFAIILSQIRLVSTKRFTRRIRRMHPLLFSEVLRHLIKTVFNE